MTAVEWLFVQMGNVAAGYETELDQGQMLEKALEMEKQQIIKAYNESFYLRDKPYATAEKYYNENFKL
jgi:hypothetical protein